MKYQTRQTKAAFLSQIVFLLHPLHTFKSELKFSVGGQAELMKKKKSLKQRLFNGLSDSTKYYFFPELRCENNNVNSSIFTNK